MYTYTYIQSFIESQLKGNSCTVVLFDAEPGTNSLKHKQYFNSLKQKQTCTKLHMCGVLAAASKFHKSIFTIQKTMNCLLEKSGNALLVNRAVPIS